MNRANRRAFRNSPQAQPKVPHHQEEVKAEPPKPELEWSDDEDDGTKMALRMQQKGDKVAKPIVYRDDAMRSRLSCDDRLLEKTRRHVFSGDVKLHDDAPPLLPREVPAPIEHDFDIPLPYVPRHVAVTLGEEALCALWREFLDYDADESELVLCKYIPSIISNMVALHGSSAPWHTVRIDASRKDDYIEYREIASRVAAVMNTPGYDTSKPEPRIPHQACCATEACHVNKDPAQRCVYQRSPPSKAGEHVVQVIFTRLRTELKGRLRHRDVPALLDEACIPYDLSKLPARFMELRGDLLVNTAAELDAFTERIRIEEEVKNPTDGGFYDVPPWLRLEFTASEIMLFTHQFRMIDLDKSGAIEAEELQALTEYMGGRITTDEAEALVAAYDVDRSGTIDFVEFLMLMFKIKNGTISLEDNILAKAMVEARSQLHIFEEIERIQSDPPPGCMVHHYGGSPLSCSVLIDGRGEMFYESCYYGGLFELQVVFHEGYPHRQPGVHFKTKIYSIHVIQQLAGSGLILHLKHHWTGSWSLRKLLEHVTGFMLAPNMNLIPPRFREPVLEYAKAAQRTSYAAAMAEAEAKDDEDFQVGDGDGDGGRGKRLVSAEDAETVAGIHGFIEAFPRLEQLHLRVLLQHEVDFDAYWAAAVEWTAKYADPKLFEPDEEEEGAEGGSGAGGGSLLGNGSAAVGVPQLRQDYGDEQPAWSEDEGEEGAGEEAEAKGEA